MTEEDMRELESLRAEKYQRTQQAHAQAALDGADVPAAFARPSGGYR